MEQIRKYAFISYSHRDIKIAKWLHKKLESYKLPTEIHNEFENSKYLRPVFRDQEDLNTGILSDELLKHLESSKYLIVICSPYSAKSEWVSSEVKTFIELGRMEFIIPFVINGTPGSDEYDECFPAYLRQYINEHPDKELLGINTQEVGREKAFVRIVSKMLGVSFDELWKRHKRERRNQLLGWSIGSPVAMFFLYYMAFPISMVIELNDVRHNLPMPENAVLIVNGAEYPLNKIDTSVVIKTIPGYYRFQTIPVFFRASYYEVVELDKRIGLGVKQRLVLNLKRDSTFSVFQGIVIDEDGNPVKDADVIIENVRTHTNMNGFFAIHFDVETETVTKSICIEKEGMQSYYRSDECPGDNLKYIMHKKR